MERRLNLIRNELDGDGLVVWLTRHCQLIGWCFTLETLVHGHGVRGGWRLWQSPQEHGWTNFCRSGPVVHRRDSPRCWIYPQSGSRTSRYQTRKVSWILIWIILSSRDCFVFASMLITSEGHIKLTDFGLSKIGLMNSECVHKRLVSPPTISVMQCCQQLEKSDRILGEGPSGVWACPFTPPTVAEHQTKAITKLSNVNIEYSSDCLDAFGWDTWP